MIEPVDVVLITALPEELKAARSAFSAATSSEAGVVKWLDNSVFPNAPFLFGTFRADERPCFTIALAAPSRMGAARTSQLATVLAERLQPKCLVMCGVCAGNPNDLALGDVVVSELVYQYDEGKLEADGFVGDHRQSPISPDWLRAAYKLTPEELPSFGRPASSDARFWVLERLHSGVDPRKHPARSRYFEAGEWREALEMLESQGFISLARGALRLTEKGTAEVQRSLLLDVDPPSTLPIDIKVGPIASGNVVVKDGLTWEKLKRLGVRSVLGLEMEAATIGEVARASSVPEWIVIKGVMDHADPKKDDRFKAFAARSSAETLRRFLVGRFNETSETSMSTTQAGAPAGKKVIAGWQPRTLNGPFMEELHAAIHAHAPRYVGMFDLARARAMEAYATADRAYAVAELVRAILGDKIKSAHSEPFGRKQVKTLHVKAENGERELIVKVWNSHDDYIGEGAGDNEDGLGISRVYAASEEATPELKSSYAGTHQESRYGPLGIYTFPDRAQFAGEWTGGHPSFGYREYLGAGHRLDCDLYLGSMAAEVINPYQPIWQPHGTGIAVDAIARHVRCGKFTRGIFSEIYNEFSF